MRTFPRSLAAFRKLVKKRGEELRKLPLEQLRALGSKAPEHLTFDSRPTTLGIIVEDLPSGGTRVIVQGFMKARWLPGDNVALDGFYKYPDGRVAPMSDEEFREFE